ncbi:hypothetical protein WB44_01525 [Synechococcus sp. WH 8020]|nr:hypothetical protein WB44_01525 [Synechococcus sp. WH 8020]
MKLINRGLGQSSVRRECFSLCSSQSTSSASKHEQPWHGVVQRRQHNVHADHLAGVAGIRDCWNPEPGGML